MVRSKVNSLGKMIESKSHRISEFNLVKECLKKLQEKYLFVPADKADNNVIVVCKCYYLEVICMEIGLWPGTTSSDTFLQPWTLKKSAVTTSLGFKEDILSDKFPHFYWTKKLHKTPCKHCF